MKIAIILIFFFNAYFCGLIADNTPAGIKIDNRQVNLSTEQAPFTLISRGDVITKSIFKNKQGLNSCKIKFTVKRLRPTTSFSGNQQFFGITITGKNENDIMIYSSGTHLSFLEKIKGKNARHKAVKDSHIKLNKMGTESKKNVFLISFSDDCIDININGRFIGSIDNVKIPEIAKIQLLVYRLDAEFDDIQINSEKTIKTTEKADTSSGPILYNSFENSSESDNKNGIKGGGVSIQQL